MRTILVANPKGGSGKTTLATNLAGWLAGKRQRVVLRDLDPQRSSTEWLERRPALFPPIIARHAKEVKPGAAESDPEWRVVDTPAGLSGDDLARRGAPRRRDARAADAVGVRHGGDAAFPRRDPEQKAIARAARRLASSRCASIRARGARASSTPSSPISISRSSRICAIRRSTSTARATAHRCSICRDRAASRTGPSGSR